MKTSQFVLIALLLLFLTPAGQAGLYRWVDAQGQVHYSDMPRPGSEEITVRKTNVSQSFRTTTSSDASALQTAGDEAARFRYTEVVVTTPTAEETLINIGGRVNVNLAIDPELQKGHGIVLYLDGRPLFQEPQARTSFVIENVFRGTHTVRAAVHSASGKVLYNTEAVTFYVRQSTAKRGS